MAIVVSAAAYLACFAGLGLVAMWHARRRGDELRIALLLGCGGLGLVTALMDPMHAPIFACVAICAATDSSSGYIYNIVLAIGGGIVGAEAIFVGPIDAMFGAATASGVSLLLYALTHGRGLGLGDVKLFGVIGAALGVRSALVAFGLSFIIGSAAVLVLFALRVGTFSRVIRFAPYIALGTVGAAMLHLEL
jgi:prepilin signal peptidase PulO-like enzyme (type II secretory pathway)